MYNDDVAIRVYTIRVVSRFVRFGSVRFGFRQLGRYCSVKVLFLADSWASFYRALPPMNRWCTSFFVANSKTLETMSSSEITPVRCELESTT